MGGDERRAKIAVAEQYDNSNIIRNVSYDQSEILYNIMALYNGGGDLIVT